MNDMNWDEFIANSIKPDPNKAKPININWFRRAMSGLSENHHYRILAPIPWDELYIMINQPEAEAGAFDQGLAPIVYALTNIGIVTTTSGNTPNYTDFPMVGMKLDRPHYDYLTKLIEPLGNIILTDSEYSTDFILYGKTTQDLINLANIIHINHKYDKPLQASLPSMLPDDNFTLALDIFENVLNDSFSHIDHPKLAFLKNLKPIEYHAISSNNEEFNNSIKNIMFEQEDAHDAIFIQLHGMCKNNEITAPKVYPFKNNKAFYLNLDELIIK